MIDYDAIGISRKFALRLALSAKDDSGNGFVKGSVIAKGQIKVAEWIPARST